METKDTNNVTIFSTDEAIDAAITTKLACFPRNGGTTSSKRVSWSETELELMDYVILDYIIKKGYSREDTAKEIVRRWGVRLTTARRYINECFGRMANTLDNDTEKLKQVWFGRVESILKDAVQSRERDIALKSLDLMAKSLGMYKEGKNITLTGDNTIKFDFQ